MSSIEQRKELHKLIMAFSHDSFHHYFSFSPWVLMTFLRLYSTVHSNDIFIKHVAVSWPSVTPVWPWRLCGTNCCISYSISSRLLTEDISLEPLVFTWLEIFLDSVHFVHYMVGFNSEKILEKTYFRSCFMFSNCSTRCNLNWGSLACFPPLARHSPISQTFKLRSSK